MVAFLKNLKPESLADFARGIVASLAVIGAYRGHQYLKENREEEPERESEELGELDLTPDK